MGRRRLARGGIGLLAAGALAAGCAGSPAGVAAPAAAAGEPGLVPFASCEGFLHHVRARARALPGYGGVALRVDAGVVPAPAARDGAADGAAPLMGGGPAFSDTNVQEAGVDEPDLVETDGRTLFAIAGSAVRSVTVTGGAPRPAGAIELPGMSPTGLLLEGTRLLVLGDAGTGPIHGDFPVSPATTTRIAPSFAVPATVLVQLDVADPAHPRVLSRMRVEGSLVGARRTGSTVRLVIASAPTRLPLASPRSYDAAGLRAARRANRRAIARANASAWLPRVTLRDAVAKRTVRRGVGCRSVSRPTRFAGVGTVSVLTVGAADALTLLDTDAILTDGELVYASPTALYVGTSRWAGPAAAGAAAPPRGGTLIHRLDTSDPTRTEYRASGAVRGYLLDQFSMSEHEGSLRVASTEEPSWWAGGDDEPSESFLTVLQERGGELTTVGRVGGLGRGERIQAVRFIGTRGYVVTFRQVDPLYALDLSDPARPAVRGELKIPGFSSYLHPIDETTLIGVGQSADEQGRTTGTQVSLFDVTDLDRPARLAQRTLDTGWSEAEADHHAFLWWPATRLLVLPTEGSGSDGGSAFGAVGLTVSRESGITPIARVRHPDDGGAWDPVRRSVVVGDALYTVSGTGVLGSDLRTLAPRGWAAFG